MQIRKKRFLLEMSISWCDITEYFADNGAEDIPFLGELFFEIDSVEHELTETLELNVDTAKFKLHKSWNYRDSTPLLLDRHCGRPGYACMVSAGNTSM